MLFGPFDSHYAFQVPESPRHHRQMLIPGWGPEGQARIASSHVAIIGMGALGCSIADALTRAGVGTITIVDRDVVELTNLQRQTLYTDADAQGGLPKVQAAQQRMREIDPAITVHAHAADLTRHNIRELIPTTVRVVVDGTDNFTTRYLLNDLCVERGTPLCYGGVIATRGMQATLTPGRHADSGACLRCLFEDPPPAGSTPTCDTAGVLGPVVSIVASAQAADTLKLLLDRSDALSKSLLEFDIWQNQRRRLDISTAKRTDCPCCGSGGRGEFLDGLIGSEDVPQLCGQNAVQIPGNLDRPHLNLETLASRLASHGSVTKSGMFVRLHSQHCPTGWSELPVITVFRDGRAIIKGTNDPIQARTLYSQLIGT